VIGEGNGNFSSFLFSLTGWWNKIYNLFLIGMFIFFNKWYLKEQGLFMMLWGNTHVNINNFFKKSE